MKTVLVIEDNEDIIELITFILQENGYKTIRANTGTAGAMLALQHNTDFILLDILLPDIAGTEVLRRIRMDKAGREIPVIAVTTAVMTGDREELLAAGCTGCIEKPFDPIQFIPQLHAILGGLA